MTYQSISINHDDHHNTHSIQPLSSRRNRSISLFVAGSLLYITFDWMRIRLFHGNTAPKTSTLKDNGEDSTNKVVSNRLFHTDTSTQTEVPIPTGVNLGSWLSLEDWFYVGNNGAVEVASPDDARAASCLPPLHLDGSTGPRWNSETDLLEGLGERVFNVFVCCVNCLMFVVVVVVASRTQCDIVLDSLIFNVYQ